MAQLVESCAIIVFIRTQYAPYLSNHILFIHNSFYLSTFLVFRIIVINFVLLKLVNTITNT